MELSLFPVKLEVASRQKTHRTFNVAGRQYTSPRLWILGEKGISKKPFAKGRNDALSDISSTAEDNAFDRWLQPRDGSESILQLHRALVDV